MHLNVGDELIKLAEVDLLLKPAKLDLSALRSARHDLRDEYGIFPDSHFVDFSRRSACHLWEDEPSNNNGDEACTGEAATEKRRQHFLYPIPATGREGARTRNLS
jgi:hypothetical protein